MDTVSIVAEKEDLKVEVPLIRNKKPTVILLGLAIIELCVDVCVGCAVFRYYNARIK